MFIRWCKKEHGMKKNKSRLRRVRITCGCGNKVPKWVCGGSGTRAKGVTVVRDSVFHIQGATTHKGSAGGVRLSGVCTQDLPEKQGGPCCSLGKVSGRAAREITEVTLYRSNRIWSEGLEAITRTSHFLCETGRRGEKKNQYSNNL